MAKSSSKRRSPPTRVDAPHSPGNPSERAAPAAAPATREGEQENARAAECLPAAVENLPPGPGAVENLAADDPQLAAEEFHLQASQLASYLRDKQRELDLRESQLNAREAEMDNRLRTTSLWEQEQVVEMSQRERELQLRIRELEEQATQLAAAAVSTENDFRATQDELDQRAERLDRQQRELQQVQRRVHRQQADLQRARQQLEEREADTEQAHRERQAEAALRQSQREQYEQQESDLRLRRQHLEKRTAQLESRRAELVELHRACQEMRLVAEQTWAFLADEFSSADLTRAVAQTRREIGEHFRREVDELQQQQERLLEIAQRVRQNQIDFESRRRKLRTWVTQQCAEIEHRAAAGS